MASSINSNPIMIQRGSDKLTVVETADNSKVTSREIANIAAQQFDFPNYTPDNASVTLVFHTESGVYLLGGVRSNPALKETPYPQQINATIGGYSHNPDLPLREAAINSIKTRMFLKTDLPGEGLKAQGILKQLCNVVENNEGWEKKICVHTDKWLEKDQEKKDIEKTMNVLTTIKHIECLDSDKAKIEEALKVIMNIKKTEGANIRTLSDFKFVELQPVIANSLESYKEDEVTKAKKAYEKFGDKIAVTFNDLAIATLAKNSAFKEYTLAQLALVDFH